MGVGEYTGAVVAGAKNFEDGLKLVYERGNEMSKCVQDIDETQTASIKAGRERTLQLMRDEPNVELALINSPIQTVISGRRENVVNILKYARKKKVASVVLNISVPTHNSIMQPASLTVRNFLNKIPISKSQIPIISNMAAEAYSDPSDVKESLSANMWNI